VGAINKELVPRLPPLATPVEITRVKEGTVSRYDTGEALQNGIFKHFPTRLIETVTPDDTDVVFKVENGNEARLDLLAFRFYKDVNLWWVIADRNRGVVRNPLRLTVGDTIFIPPVSVVFSEIVT